MAKQVNPVIHELAVIIASQQGKTPVNPKGIKTFYGNYLVAVKTLSELEKDEEFQKNPQPKSTYRRSPVC